MKNNLKKLIVLLFSSSILLTSCAEEKGDFDSDNGPTAYLFSRTATNLAVSPTGVSAIKIGVDVTTKTNSDRRIPIKIDAASTALPAEYTITDATLVIPAGKYNGEIEIVGNFNAVPAGVTKTLIIDLDTAAGISILDTKGRHTVEIARFCATNLVGSYSVTTIYGFHDFLPNYASNTMITAVTAITGFTGTPPRPIVNTYRVADFSGGLYSTGPYATSYGTGAAADAALRDLTFAVNCGALSWPSTGLPPERDAYGPIVPTPGAVNSFNPTTGNFTISWTSTRWGERGVSVYTRQ